MPVTIDATIGGASANSYCTLAEANTYHESHPYASVWDDASNDEKNRALVSATRILDEQWDWFGTTVTSTQRLLWPRNGMYYETGYYIPGTVIPEKLKQATAEFARQLLAADRTADSDVIVQGISRLAVGSIDIEFSGDVKQTQTIPDAVYFMLEEWGDLKRRGGGTARLIRT